MVRTVADLARAAKESAGDLRPSPLAHAARKVGKRRRDLIAPDAHAPDHDRGAWSIFLAAVRDLAPDCVRIIGDFLDLESLNRHPPTGEDVPDLSAEYASGNRLLDDIDRAIGKRPCRRVYMEGNHEQRFAKQRGLWPRAIRSLIPDPQEAMRLKERGYEWVRIPYDEARQDGRRTVEVQPVREGSLWFHHGDYYNLHHSHKHLAEYQVSQVYGHTHRAQQHYRTVPDPVTGRCERVVHVTGLPCLRRLRAPWRPQPRMTGWTNGFGVIEWHGDEASVYPVVIRNGVAAYGDFRWRA
jgi:hypothetical protein